MKKAKNLIQKIKKRKGQTEPTASSNELGSVLEPIQFIEGGNEDDEVVINLEGDLFKLTLKETTGSNNNAFSLSLLIQTTLASCVSETKGIQIANSVAAAMFNINPQDSLEGMMAAQMVAVHNQAMGCLKRANFKGQPFEIAKSYRNQAIKLMRTFTAQVSVLKKYRTGGQQKLIVEHVHIHRGGQAIVGNVTHGGGGGEGDDKK